MHGQIGLLFPWKASSHSTVLPSFFVLLCAVFSCFCASGCEAYIRLLRQMDMGSLTCAQMWVRVVHTRQAHTSLHKSWLGGIEKLPLQGVEPRVFGFEFWRTNPLSHVRLPLCPGSSFCAVSDYYNNSSNGAGGWYLKAKGLVRWSAYSDLHNDTASVG